VISNKPFLLKRLFAVSFLLILFLIVTMLLGISIGSTGNELKTIFQLLSGERSVDPMREAIIWEIRFPRVILAALVGATLSLGGLVFQVLPRFPGVAFTAFAGSVATLLLIVLMSSGQSILKKDSLLLSGVMINAFCSAIIMFLVSMTQDARLHNIIFWLMGDLSMSDTRQVVILAATLFPCFLLLFLLSHSMNLLLMGQEMAQTMGVNIKLVTMTLLNDSPRCYFIYGERYRKPLRPSGVCRAGHTPWFSSCPGTR